jgi:hypothetical protein
MFWGRLDGDASAVEGDALADERQHGAALASAGVAQHDHLCRLVGATRDSEERAHLQPAHVVDLEDFQVEARSFDGLLHLLDKDGRREGVRRRIDPLPDAIGGIGEQEGVFHRGRRRLVPVEADDAQGAELRHRVLVTRLQRAHVEVAEPDPFGDGARHVGSAGPRSHVFGEDHGNSAMTALPQHPSGGLQGVAQPHHVQVLGFSDADQDGPLAGHGIEVMDGDQFHELAAELPVREQLRDGAL